MKKKIEVTKEAVEDVVDVLGDLLEEVEMSKEMKRKIRN